MAIQAGVLAGLLGYGGVTWVSQNVLGTSDWLSHYFSPQVSSAPNTRVGATVSDFAVGGYYFKFQILAPTDEDIKGLDDFFEAYGYRVDRYGKPNLRVRDNFTYVKTRDAVVKSSVPQAAEQMRAMLNSGCRFHVGDIK